jgi:coenzyme PQQ synthesis protein D (PqqD)
MTTRPTSSLTPPALPREAWFRPGVAITPTEDGVTLVNAAGDIYTVGESGRVAVEALRASRGATGAAAALRDRYGLDDAAATGDLLRFLDELLAAKLLRIKR